LEYAAQGLVPWDILQSEPGITVAVNFCLRTTGVDYPEDEYSDASDPMAYSTTWSNLDRDEPSDPYGSSTTALDSYREMSKTKKEVIKAVIKGHQAIELERRNDVVCSEGVFDSFL
jgi:hypothetical protein